VKMYIYESSPLDDFHGLSSAKEIVSSFMRRPVYEYYCPNDHSTKFTELFELAMRCARFVSMAEKSHWEGDIGDLHFFAVPQPPDRIAIGLVWKQGNNGTTYICSPIPLPWVETEGGELLGIL